MVVRPGQLEYKEFLHSKRFAFDSLRTPPRVHRQGEGRPRCDVPAGLQFFHEISSHSRSSVAARTCVSWRVSQRSLAYLLGHY